MTSADLAQPLVQPAVQAALTAGGSGNPAPLGLAGFAATTVVLGVSLAALADTFFVLGAGKYGGNGLTVKTGGYMGLVVAFRAAYLSRAEFCEAS